MTAALVLVGVGLGSYLLRVSMLLLAQGRGLPPVLARSAAFAVPVSFAAIAVGTVSEHLARSPIDVTLPVAVVATALTARRTGSPNTALLVGMAALWILTALTPS